MAPHDREKPHQDRHDGHHLRPDSLNGALLNRCLKIGSVQEPPLALPLFIRVVEVEKHHDSGLGVYPGQRDNPDPDSYAQVIAEEIEEPDRPNEGKGDCQEHDEDLGHYAGTEVKKHEHNHQGQGDDDGETSFRPLEVLELPRPAQVIPLGDLDHLGDHFLCFIHVADQVPAGHIDEHIAYQSAALVPNGGRTCRDPDVGQLGHGDLGPHGSGDQDALERLDIVPQLAGITNLDGIPFPSFNRHGDLLASDGGLDDIFHIHDLQAVARRLLPPNLEVDEVATGCSL